jgi:carbon-monoxide dehydrogenase large subunit
MGQFAMGQPMPRTEDPRLLTGRGKYHDDYNAPQQCHAFVLRSPHAHARIVSIDTREALRMPGVVAILTGEDWAKENFGHIPPSMPRQRRDGSPIFVQPRPALAHKRAMLVGDPVAFVVAESISQAKDAAELIEVSYEALPALTDTARVGTRKAPALWEGCPDNETFFYTLGDKAAVDAAFAKAHHVTRLRTVINRVTAATMEPRGCVGEWDARDERYTLYTGTQRPHGTRLDLATKVLKIPESQLRVVAGEVGGSFGMKGGHYPEYALSLWASKRIGRPVKWISERSEGMATDDHDRDHISSGELALDKDGKFLALRVSNVSNIGAFIMPGGLISPTAHLGGLAGTYTTPAIYVEVSAVFSNTACNGPYRGSGRPEASYLLERLIDNAARETGMDRGELRRRNTISTFPFKTGLVYHYDCGDFAGNLARALELAGYPGFEQRRAEAKKRGRLRGIGMGNIIEQTSQAFGETVEVRFDPTGGVTVVPGSISHGQGHETMYKIVVSDRLGVPAERIRVARNDTDLAADGGGTFASRTAVLGGSAARIASDRIIEKGKKIAAHLLEAAAADMAFDKGVFRVAGTDRKVSIDEVARAAFQRPKIPAELEPGLIETSTFTPEIPNFPTGCHICEVEIDPETGATEVLRYTVVDDVGTVINPLTLEGQIHGGIGQGVGQAFTEHMIYDPESGQLLTGSFMDYGMPRASDMCSFDMENHPVPTKTNPIGAKGAGEAGNVGALAAIMNAVVDALSPLGINHIDMPATGDRVWRAIRAGRS